MAHLVAGMPAFLGFTGMTSIALWGHVLYAAVAAGIIESQSEFFEFPKSRHPAQV
jgi:hypothetical protein